MKLVGKSGFFFPVFPADKCKRLFSQLHNFALSSFNLSAVWLKEFRKIMLFCGYIEKAQANVSDGEIQLAKGVRAN